MIPAIVLSAHTMALGVVRALGSQQVPVVVVHYDPRDMAHCSRFVVESVAAPHPEREEERFVELLLALSARWPGAVLIPASDETLVVAARHKARLQQHFVVACPDAQTVGKVIDKQLTYPLAAAAGVAVPRTLNPSSLGELRKTAGELLYPCLVKPAQSHRFYARFGCKMFVAADGGELLGYYMQAAAAGLDVMVQEYIPGDDAEVFNYNAYAVGGRPLVEFTARHIRSAPPRYGSPRVVLSLAEPGLLEPGRRVLAALGYTGYACTEFKRDPRDGQFKLMEVNARHNLSTLLAVTCGINFPWLEYRRLAYGETPTASDFQSGVYWIDLTRDLAYSLGYFFSEGLRLGDYLRPYRGDKVWAIYDRNDLRPFVRRVSYLAGHVGRSLRLLQNRRQPEPAEVRKPIPGK